MREQKQIDKKLVLTVNTAETDMNPGDPQLIAEAVEDAGNLTTLSGYAEARACRSQRMTKDAEQFKTHAKMMRTKRWQDKCLT